MKFGLKGWRLLELSCEVCRFADTFRKGEDSMNESNEFSRATIIAGQTFKRLQKAGVPYADAKNMVAAAINAEEADMKERRRPFDETGFVERLRGLP